MRNSVLDRKTDQIPRRSAWSQAAEMSKSTRPQLQCWVRLRVRL